jgi:hypothetical protein
MTNTDRARQQAAQFIHEHHEIFAADIDFWTEAIAGQLLKFQFNEFKLEVTTSHVSQQDIDNELAKYL